MKNKFLNIKVGVEFNDLLITHEVFKKNWKAISPAKYFLDRMSGYNVKHGNDYNTFSSTIISDIFKPYTKGNYKTYLDALRDLKLVEFEDNDYHLPSEWGAKDGICRKYKVTDLAVDLLSSANYEYLKTLHTDKDLKRKTEKNISQSKIMKKEYNNPVLNHIHDGHVNCKLNFEKLLKSVENGYIDVQSNNESIKHLLTFSKKNFLELHKNDADGRVYNEFVGMKSVFRQFLTYKNMHRRVVLDIRACHATFFSSYLLNYAYINILPHFASHLPSLQGITDKADNIKAFKQGLNEEHSRWTEMFCGENDPRIAITKECGFEDESKCKVALNATINGLNTYKRLIRWLHKNFPLLCWIWDKTDKEQTGNRICEEFECGLMLNERFYKLADSMGLKLMYEYDGFSIFAPQTESDESLNIKIKELSIHLQNHSHKYWGIRIIINTKWDVEDDFVKMGKKEQYELKRFSLYVDMEKKHELYLKWIRRTRGFKTGTLEDIKRCSMAKDRFISAKNELLYHDRIFEEENPFI